MQQGKDISSFLYTTLGTFSVAPVDITIPPPSVSGNTTAALKAINQILYVPAEDEIVTITSEYFFHSFKM